MYVYMYICILIWLHLTMVSFWKSGQRTRNELQVLDTTCRCPDRHVSRRSCGQTCWRETFVSLQGCHSWTPGWDQGDRASDLGVPLAPLDTLDDTSRYRLRTAWGVRVDTVSHCLILHAGPAFFLMYQLDFDLDPQEVSLSHQVG